MSRRFLSSLIRIRPSAAMSNAKTRLARTDSEPLGVRLTRTQSVGAKTPSSSAPFAVFSASMRRPSAIRPMREDIKCSEILPDGGVNSSEFDGVEPREL